MSQSSQPQFKSNKIGTYLKRALFCPLTAFSFNGVTVLTHMEIAQPFPGRWTMGPLLSTAGEEKRLTQLSLNTQGAGLGH